MIKMPVLSDMLIMMPILKNSDYIEKKQLTTYTQTLKNYIKNNVCE